MLPSTSPQWSVQARSIWGKTDAESGLWLPLVTHLEDTARVMDLFWETLPPAIVRPYTLWAGTDIRARSLLRFIAGVHDVGKASAFVLKAALVPGHEALPDFVSLMSAAGVSLPAQADRNVRHGVVGQVTLQDWLKHRHGWASRDAMRLSCIVGGHHGVNPSPSELARIGTERQKWDSDGLRDVRLEILEKMAAFTGADELLAESAGHQFPIPLQVLTEALVIQADWIASNTEFFPLRVEPDMSERAQRGWERLDLPGPWAPDPHPDQPEALFHSRFPELSRFSPSPMQSSLVTAAGQLSQPGMLILEAPMGSGKTEAALMAAEVLASRFGANGVFVGLPTMATANPMFSRVRGWLEHIPAAAATSINLAHSKAALNPEFHHLMAEAAMASMGDDIDDLAASSEGVQQALVHEWTTGRQKGLLAQHVIGTVDQLLFAGLKTKHVVLRHFGLASKVVIIDEVHAADQVMRVYLKRVLRWLRAYGTPVILMSATLPPAQRREYLEAYAGGVLDLQDESESDVYPRITSFDGTVQTIGIPDEGSGNIVTLELDAARTSLPDLIRQRLKHGGCVGIIRNTVASAQSTYQELSAAFPDIEVVLTHSRFLAPHRMRREADLVARLGRTGDRPERLIVVGTQVLEQSLDVDFDLLVSDLAPTDLMMQRIGRLHRHERGRRPPGLESPTMIVTGVEDSATGPVFHPGSQRIYGESQLLRTMATLFPPGSDRFTLHLPTGIAKAVRKAYETTIEVPEAWRARFAAAQARELQVHSAAISGAESFALDTPGRSNLNGFIADHGSDPETPRGLARVRDSEDSLTVFVIRRDADGTVRVPGGVGPLSGRVIPRQLAPYGEDAELARVMATCSVALPQHLARLDVIDELERSYDVSGWQGSPWLRGELFLVLDEDGMADLSVSPLSYHDDIGLITVAQSAKEER